MSITESDLSSLAKGEKVVIKFRKRQGSCCTQLTMLMLTTYDGHDETSVVCAGTIFIRSDVEEIRSAKKILEKDDEKDQETYFLWYDDPDGGDRKKLEQTAGSEMAAVAKKKKENQEFSVSTKG